MFIRKYWVPISVVLLVICAVGFLILAMQPSPDPIIIYKEVEVEKPTAEAPVAERPPPPGASPHGHWHGDEWHDAPHEADDTAPAVSAGKSYIPEGVDVTPNFPPVDPNDDPVEAAYKRLEYIKNNPYAWGGVANPETPGLIAKLMPAPDGFSGPTAHSDVEETIDLLGSLDPNDPRSAEVMATYLCEGRVGGRGPKNALVNMGVPAVPYLIPYMLDMERSPLLRSRALEVLCRIGERHREDLDGIVEHIIIPRLEAILSQEKPDYFEGNDAREYLPRLK